MAKVITAKQAEQADITPDSLRRVAEWNQTAANKKLINTDAKDDTARERHLLQARQLRAIADEMEYGE